MRLMKFLSLLFVVLAGAACSDSTQHGDASRPVVNIGRLICGGHLSLAVVESRYQDDLPFHLKTIQNHDWNDVIRDLKSGKLMGTFILSPLAMQMIRNGLPAKIVMMADRNGNGFVLSNKFQHIEDLKGKHAIIAVPHRYSQHHVLLYLALKKHGVPYRDVKVLAMPPRDMINSLRRGEIDGFVVGEPEGNRSLSLGVGHMVAISPQIWKDHLDHVFLVTDAFIHDHPDQLQALITALKRGGTFIEQHPHEAAVMGEDYTGASAAVFEQVLTTPPEWIDYSDMMPSDQRIHDMAAVMVEMGLWKDIPANLADYTDQRFIRKASAAAQ